MRVHNLRSNRRGVPAMLEPSFVRILSLAPRGSNAALAALGDHAGRRAQKLRRTARAGSARSTARPTCPACSRPRLKPRAPTGGPWSELPIPFPAAQAGKLPEHWTIFGQRASLITGGPRLATNPAGAILNYLYALLEAETIFACRALGLDPGLGIFHTDRRDRSSLALGTMEAARPAVDACVLALLTQRTFSPHEFVETREGACRITPKLAAELPDTCTAWRGHVAPAVEWIAYTLTNNRLRRLPLRTPLTRRNWKQAWDERAPDRRLRRSRAEFVALPNTCLDCGALLPDRRRRYCDEHRAERFRSAVRRRVNKPLWFSRSYGQSNATPRTADEPPSFARAKTPRTRQP